MDITSYLDRDDGQRPCMICRRDDIARDLEVYVEAHRAGRTAQTPLRVWREYVYPKYKAPQTATTVRKHVRQCLGYEGV